MDSYNGFDKGQRVTVLAVSETDYEVAVGLDGYITQFDANDRKLPYMVGFTTPITGVTSTYASGHHGPNGERLYDLWVADVEPFKEGPKREPAPEGLLYTDDVVKIARKYARAHNLCEVVDQALVEIGAIKVENKTVKVTLEFELPVTSASLPEALTPAAPSRYTMSDLVASVFQGDEYKAFRQAYEKAKVLSTTAVYTD